MIASGVYMYYLGENKKQLFKWLMGLPIGGLWILAGHPWIGLMTMLAYYIATVAFGYGEKNPWTKWLGERNAIILTGAALGAAMFPIVGMWAILSMCISGTMWYWLWTKDGVINEPYVAIGRSLSALILLVV
jgi:hypothetical protein